MLLQTVCPYLGASLEFGPVCLGSFVTSQTMMFNQSVFIRRLNETVAWCEARGVARQPRESLRSERLRPQHEVWTSSGGDWSALSTEQRVELVATLARQRAEALNHELPSSAWLEAARMRGRLLLFTPGESGWDGMCDYHSGGFFDEFESPPWDTWVDFVVDEDPTTGEPLPLLICWIPEKLAVFADDGAAVSALAGLRWAIEVDCSLVRSLRQAGLLGQ